MRDPLRGMVIVVRINPQYEVTEGFLNASKVVRQPCSKLIFYRVTIQPELESTQSLLREKPWRNTCSVHHPLVTLFSERA